jgi:hypothetical protein
MLEIKIFWRYIKLFLLSLLLVFSFVLLLEFALRTTIGADNKGIYSFKGYRGKQIGDKKADEFRVAAFGGSETFGACVLENETWPFYLEGMLEEKVATRPVSVVNLAHIAHAIYGIWHDAQLFSYMDYDLAVIYAGYNDIDPTKIQKRNSRGDDVVFRIFGFRRLVPAYLREKAMLLKYPHLRGDSPPANGSKDNKNNQQKSVAFRLGEMLDSTASKLLGTPKNVQLELQEMDLHAKKMMANQTVPYEHFLSFYEKIVDWLLVNNKKVLIVSPLGLDQSIQQNLLRSFLSKYNGNSSVSYLSLDKTLDLEKFKKSGLTCDAMHLKAEGNRRVAKEILAGVLPMAP